MGLFELFVCSELIVFLSRVYCVLTTRTKSIRSVSLWQFMVATIFTFPRFLLYVFIGSRLAALADGEQRGKMDKSKFAVEGYIKHAITHHV